MLTLQELKQIVKVPGQRDKVPTAKELSSFGILVVKKNLNGSAEIAAYKDGYAVYRAGGYATVFPIHSCGAYSYGPDESEHIAECFFEGEAWYMRLVLEGEDRLEHNQRAKKKSTEVSYSAASEEWRVLKASGSSALERIAREETIKESLAVLTEPQRRAAFRCLIEQKTQRQISKELGLTVQAVSAILLRTASRIEKGKRKCVGRSQKKENNISCG